MTVNTTGLNCTNGVCALADTIVNNFYFSQMSVQGDTTPPYTWQLISGTLPSIAFGAGYSPVPFAARLTF